MKILNQEPVSVLPNDGVVEYHGKVMSAAEAAGYFALLFNNIGWKNDEAVIFGKHIITKRKAAWYGDSDYNYTYSNITKQALVWTRELVVLKQLAEELTASTYNSCLLNLYHDGDEGVGWHSDDEKTLGRHPTIASLTFGAERKFSFRHKQTKQTISLILESGSLLVMKGETQANWMHTLPRSKKIMTPRINLTFRQILH